MGTSFEGRPQLVEHGSVLFSLFSLSSPHRRAHYRPRLLLHTPYIRFRTLPTLTRTRHITTSRMAVVGLRRRDTLTRRSDTGTTTVRFRLVECDVPAGRWLELPSRHVDASLAARHRMYIRGPSVVYWRCTYPCLLAVSEIVITRCMVSAIMVGDLCAPDTTVEQDAVKGKWVRVERDLNLQSGLWSLVRQSIYTDLVRSLIRSTEYLL